MRQVYQLLIMILIPMFFGCAIKHEYVWREMPIKNEVMPPEVILKEGKVIDIIKGKSDDEKIMIGSVPPHQYFATEQLLTDAIADQLSIELRKRDVEIKPACEKIIEIAVDSFQFERNLFIGRICTTLDIKVKLGKDKNKLLKVYSCTPSTVNRLYDGVVQVAVMDILKDLDVLAYINS
jgi:hypothetical protein